MESHTILKQRLSQNAEVIQKGEERWEEARTQLASYRGNAEQAVKAVASPLIVYPATKEDVCETVKFATTYNFRIVVRSGGHQYVGLSAASSHETKVLQVDLKNFDRFALSTEIGATDDSKYRSVYVGAAVRLGVLYQTLNEHDLLIPGGNCVNVAAGGHFQSSAFGAYAKFFGLGLDHVTHVDVVLASGEHVTASATEYTDLYWALRGGSPGAFGIVFGFQINAVNVKPYKDAFGARFSWEYSEETFSYVYDEVLRLKHHPLYKKHKEMRLELLVFPDVFGNMYQAAQETAPQPHTIVLGMIWTGSEHGSIFGEIPNDIRTDDIPVGSTFYDFFVAPFKVKHISTTSSLTREFHFSQDPKYTLSFCMIALSAHPDPCGLLKKRRQDIVKLANLLLDPQEVDRFVDESEDLALKDGIDLEMEQLRYLTRSNWVDHLDFDPKALKQALIETMRLHLKNPHLTTLIMCLDDGDLNEHLNDGSNAFPCRDMRYGYGVWTMWRSSLGKEVSDAAAEVAENSDKVLSKAISLGRPMYNSIWAAGEDNMDITDPAVRRRYYPDDDLYRKLQLVKRKYDPKNIFHNQFTVPPASDADARQTDLSNIVSINPKKEMYVPYMDLGAPQLVLEGGRNRNTIIGLMERTVKSKGGKPYLTWLNEDGSSLPSISFRQFRKDVVAYATWLQKVEHITKGDRVVLCYLPGTEFFKVFMAVMYLGAVPVPSCPVDFSSQASVALFRHIVDTSKAKCILADKQVLAYRIKSLVSSLLGFGKSWVIPKKWSNESEFVLPPLISGGDDAFIQFSSGTNHLPKGVVYTHTNILFQLKNLEDRWSNDANSAGLMWVPHFHDLGLIGHLLIALAKGGPLFMMSPVSFLRNPELWFSAISTYRVTHTSMPNFAFGMIYDRLCSNNGTQLMEMGWDLSSMQVLMSGGEPIDPILMTKLLQSLRKHCRLPSGCYTAAYGGAELLGITFGEHKHQEEIVKRLDPVGLIENQLELVADGGIPIAGCGKVSDTVPIAIVNADGMEMKGEDNIGEIWVNGPGVADRYIDEAHERRSGTSDCSALEPGPSKIRSRSEMLGDLSQRLDTKYGRWFATGDHGFIHKGELYVLGRIQDRVDFFGSSSNTMSMYANLIEASVNRESYAKDFRKGGTTLFVNELTKKTCIAVELRRFPGDERMEGLGTVAQNIYGHVKETFGGLELDTIHFMPPRSASKTTSGKLRRVLTGKAISGTGGATSKSISTIAFQGPEFHSPIKKLRLRAPSRLNATVALVAVMVALVVAFCVFSILSKMDSEKLISTSLMVTSLAKTLRLAFASNGPKHIMSIRR